MTCDEAKERAVLFRAALSTILEVSTNPFELHLAIAAADAVLKRYPFDAEAITVLRKMVKKQ